DPQIRSLYLDPKELDPHNHNPDAHKRGCAGDSFDELFFLDPENPEIKRAKERNDLEPLRKATTNRSPEQDLSFHATTTTNSSLANPTLEKTNIPPASPAFSPRQDGSTLVKLSNPITPISDSSAERFSPEEREWIIDEAIETYNQYRGKWGECRFLSDSKRNFLAKKLMGATGTNDQRRSSFLEMVRDAVLWCGRSEYLNKPDFDGKHFNFLVGDFKHPDRMADYASQWRSLPEEQMVGAAFKITAAAAEKTFCLPDGKPCSEIKAKYAWWDISDAVIKGQSVSQGEKDWAIYYFPKSDIYKGDDELNA
ncbi:MAG: hypothetical protein ACRCZS_24415, partial [Chroococcidiopsis sp.]